MPANKEIDELFKTTKWDTVMHWVWWKWVYLLVELPREIKWFCQRGVRGYSDRDMWSMDFYLADIIPKMLRKFKSGLTGCPGQLAIHSKVEEGMKKWEEILDKIIFAFEMYKKIDDSECTPTKEDMKKVDEGLKLFIEWLPNLWD